MEDVLLCVLAIAALVFLIGVLCEEPPRQRPSRPKAPPYRPPPPAPPPPGPPTQDLDEF